MNPASTSLKQLQISTPTDTTIILTRAFDAPRRLVWEAMFTPDKMRRWMLPPPGYTITTCVCDPRVGGALELAWKTDEADPAMTLRGVFTEVLLHERIARRLWERALKSVEAADHLSRLIARYGIEG